MVFSLQLNLNFSCIYWPELSEGMRLITRLQRVVNVTLNMDIHVQMQMHKADPISAFIR